MALGEHRLEYEVLEGWEQLPEGWSFVEVAGVAVDSRDRVYVFNRGEHPVIVFDRDGKFLDAWGEGVFTNAHGIFIDRNDHVYCCDNLDHTVRKFTTDGELLMTLGGVNEPSDTGFEIGASPVQRASGPFNGVTNVAVVDDGEMFISDGYGNARVHRFAADGTHLASWGAPGAGIGEFNLPHAIAVDGDGRVLVADRENSRIQIFDRDGGYLESWDWVNRPDDLFIDEEGTLYVAELGWNVPHRDVPHYRFMPHPPRGHPPIARVTVCDLEGAIKLQIGGFSSPLLPGNFIVPHGIWADSRGDLYIGEVVKASGAVDHFAPLTCHAFQKFVRSGR